MADIQAFIANFTTAVDFQQQVEIRPDTKLADLPEWDSLAALGVIIMFDSEYGLTITGNDLKSCATVQDICSLVDAKAK
jgi:acyl carrier protein